jgi:hypothetical protein
MSDVKVQLAEFPILTEARTARAEQIAKHERSIARLRACTCGYPIIRFKNGHGHAETCPVAKMIGDPPRRER